jgi:hypothetical protein
MWLTSLSPASYLEKVDQFGGDGPFDGGLRYPFSRCFYLSNRNRKHWLVIIIINSRKIHHRTLIFVLISEKTLTRSFVHLLLLLLLHLHLIVGSYVIWSLLSKKARCKFLEWSLQPFSSRINGGLAVESMRYEDEIDNISGTGRFPHLTNYFS